VFGGAFVMALIASGLMAILPGATPSPMQGLHMGLLVGAGFVATSFGINYLFAQRSLVMWLIDGGYHIGQFALIGLILGAWR
jgi:hypothetical protein